MKLLVKPGTEQIDQQWGWFCLPGLTIFLKEVIFKKFCQPVKTSFPSAENINKIPELNVLQGQDRTYMS